MKWVVGIFLALSCGAHSVRAGELEATAAASYDKIDGAGAKSGLSLRARYLFTGDQGSAFFLQSNFPGPNVFIIDAVGGYTFRSRSKVYVEGGAGIRYSNLWGMGFAALVGTGWRFSDRFHLSLPLYLKFGLSYEFTPYIGYRF